jgi:hypothetical protein
MGGMLLVAEIISERIPEETPRAWLASSRMEALQVTKAAMLSIFSKAIWTIPAFSGR